MRGRLLNFQRVEADDKSCGNRFFLKRAKILLSYLILRISF